jgi:hypothetical protein
VHAGTTKKRPTDRWVPLPSAFRLPLTGLTRKIIRGLGDA